MTIRLILEQLHAAGVITAREHQILDLREREGGSQYRVAVALGISRSTVKSIEKNAHAKIQRHNEQEAA